MGVRQGFERIVARATAATSSARCYVAFPMFPISIVCCLLSALIREFVWRLGVLTADGQNVISESRLILDVLVWCWGPVVLLNVGVSHSLVHEQRLFACSFPGRDFLQSVVFCVSVVVCLLAFHDCTVTRMYVRVLPVYVCRHL